MRIGTDSWSGSGVYHKLPDFIIQHLAHRNVIFLAQIVDWAHTSWRQQAWLQAGDLEIPQEGTRIWGKFIWALKASNIRITDKPDNLIWAVSKDGHYTPKLGYLELIKHREPPIKDWWWSNIWRLKAPHKHRLLFWCLLKDCIPTTVYLHRRAFHGASRCCYCLNDREDALHLFLHCRIIQNIWSSITTDMGCRFNWQGNSLSEAWSLWWQLSAHNTKLRNLPLIVTWELWIGRNNLIFNDKPIDCQRISAASLATYKLIPEDSSSDKHSHETPETIDYSRAWAYFDGAANAHGCGGEPYFI